MKRLLIAILLATATIFTSIGAAAASSDLSIAVTVNPETAVLGDEIIYNCTVTNHGPDTTTGMHGYISPDNGTATDIYMSFDTA